MTRNTIRVQAPEPPSPLMLALEERARELMEREGYTAAAAARWACEGLECPEPVAVDVAERIRR